MFKTSRRQMMVAAAAAGLAFATGAQAQDPKLPLPDGNINFIIPVPPGGGTDMAFRALMEASRPYLGRSVVVYNLPGAGSAVGLGQAARKPANGLNLNSYTSEIFTLPVFMPVTFSGKDFRPIIMVNEDPACIVVPAESKYTLESFIAAAKAKPGAISMGNSGFGNIWHLSAAAFAKKAGIELLQVPYNGAAPTVSALLGGQIDAFVASPPEVIEQVKGGKMKVLAVMSDKRVAILPDVPTLKEKGIDLSIGTWRAVGAPSGVSDEAVKALHDAFYKGMQEKSFIDFMHARGLTIRYMDTKTLTEFVAHQKPQFEALATEVKATQKQ